ncbi:MAG TPA: hypothetical protein VFE51_15520 [Verrucomicrobiae bacterium]|nr:hypothetical protein [Verrucomicrobiae bacterium]
MQFYLLARGAVFEFNGRRFTKTAMSMARGEDGNGNVFAGERDVVPVGQPLLLSEIEAARWKPSDVPWTDCITPAPGQS